MKNTYIKIVIILFVFIFSTDKSFSINNDTIEKMNHSIQFSPIGILFRSYKINYEYYKNKNGFLIENKYYFNENSRGDQLLSSYRRYLKNSIGSSFIGFFTSYSINTEEKNLQDQFPGFILIPPDYYYKIKTQKILVGANFGKRWLFKHGLGLSMRIGWGYPFISGWSENKPDLIELNEYEFKFEDGIDGELTIGINF